MRIWFLFVLASTILTGCANSPPHSAPSAQTSDSRLTYDAVLTYFSDTGMQKTEVHPRCTIYSEGEWASATHYDYCLIVLENSDKDFQVTFYLTDAHEMNWITEFFDSPFFTRTETEKLFGMLNTGQELRNHPVGRYRVDFHHWKPRHAEIFVFSFTRS